MMAHHRIARPYWSQVLRSLREARGMTQDGWAMQIGYGRATVRRWEAGTSVPSAHAEGKIIALCHERALFRRYSEGPLAGTQVTPDWLADLLASARLENVPSEPSVPPPSTTSSAVTRYARSGDVSIAYQVFGNGPIDLVVTPGMVSHRELEWEHPGFAEFFERLASFARVIIFDKRGTGMSDRVQAGSLEERIDDIRAVMDSAGSSRAALLGISEGGPMSILFAATYPERTQALLLYGAYASEWDPIEHPLGAPVPSLEDRAARVRQVWGSDASAFVRNYAPSVADDPAEIEWWARYQRISASPGAAIALMAMNDDIDVRHVLSAIRVPTLVMHREGDRAVDVEHGRYIAERIVGARYVELDGIDHLPMYGDVERITGEVETFLTSGHLRPEVDSRLATVMSTKVTIDEPQHERGAGHSLHGYWESVRREIDWFRGIEVNQDGDGVLARFDGPTRAVRCAARIRDVARSMGLEARSGLHTGELELEEGGVSGSALVLTDRIADFAQPGEILASNTVTDLVPGSGFEFEDRSRFSVEDVPGEWRLSSLGDTDD